MTHRILLVRYYYPPDPSVGSHRWHALARHLRRLGNEVTVLTTSAFGTMPDDDGQVVRTPDIVTSGLLRRLLRRPPISSAGMPTPRLVPPPRLLSDGPVPDPWLITWLPFVVPAVRRLLRSGKYDCLVTSSPPHSTHLVGLAVRRNRPLWIADFEDGWRFDALRDGWPTRLQDRLDGALEARVVRSADRLVAVTPPIVADFDRRFGPCADLVPMAWDPDLDEEFDSACPPQLDADRVNIVHTGTFADPFRRDPTGFITALNLFAERHPDEAERTRIVLAGSLSPEEQDLLAQVRRDGLVRHVGALHRSEAVALQRRADALLLLTSGDHTSAVTGKIYEYLAANRPIIALAQDNEVVPLIYESNAGVVVAPNDVDGIVGVLRDTVSGHLAASFSPRGLERYRYPSPAKDLIESIERTIASNRAPRSM
jgi:glycosyltransferase involved in cell wall biosynthesis